MILWWFPHPPPPSLSLQPPKDIHLVLCVAVLLVVDVTILTISTALNATRIEAVVIPNKEKLTGEDVSGVVQLLLQSGVSILSSH